VYSCAFRVCFNAPTFASSMVLRKGGKTLQMTNIDKRYKLEKNTMFFVKVVNTGNLSRQARDSHAMIKSSSVSHLIVTVSPRLPTAKTEFRAGPPLRNFVLTCNMLLMSLFPPCVECRTKQRSPHFLKLESTIEYL
jgi:hypothetical protein